MRKALIAVAAFILIFTHLIPPSNFIFATEEINECENMSFTVNSIRENDVTISGTAESSQSIEIEFKTKNISELISVDDNGEFSFDIEDGLLESNDIISISNDYFIIETAVMPAESEEVLIQSTQYAECPVIEENNDGTLEEEAAEPENTTEENNDESSEEEISEEEPPESESITEENADETLEEEISEEELPESESTEADSLVEEYSELFNNSFIEIETTNIPEIASIDDPNSLAEVQILSNTEIDATLSESVNPDYYNLNINLNGTGIGDVELVSPDRTVVFYSQDLAGELAHNNGTASVQVQILPINLEEDIPVLYNAVGGLTNTLSGVITSLLEGIDDALGLIPSSVLEVSGLTELSEAINNLNNIDNSLQELMIYDEEVEYTINPNGSIVVNFSNGLGEHLDTVVKSVVQDLLNDVSSAADSLEIRVLDDVPLLGGILRRLVNPLLLGTVNNIVGLVTNLSDNLTTGVIDLTDNLASAQVIGETNVNLDVLVNNPPGNIQGVVPIIGAGIQASSIDVNLLTEAEGQTEIVFPDTIAPALNSATIEGNGRNGYIVSGSEATEPDDIVNVINSEGNIVGTGSIDVNGNFSIELTELVPPDEVLTVQAVDEAGNESNTLQVTVPPDIIRIESVPDIVFNTTSITNEETLILRQSENNSVQIMDTRRDGNWMLSAEANPLSNVNNQILSNALIYIKSNGEEVPLENGAVAVASNEDASSLELIDTIYWSDNEGVLLRLNPILAQAETPYRSTITWTLNDAPQ